MLKFGGITAMAEEDYQSYRPLCFAYLSSYLKKYLPPVEVVVSQNVEDLLDAGCDLIGVSATTTNFNKARSIARKIRDHSPSIHVLVGGVHITVLPHTLPDCFDVGVVGEGEQTITDLLKLKIESGSLAPKDLSGVAGIVYRENGKIMRTAAQELIDDLDRIPIPDRNAVGFAEKKAYMFTSRGCPYDCAFCSSQLHWGRYRTFSPQYVINEIEHLARDFGVEEIHFFDDLFVADIRRLEEIAKGIRERGWNESLRFSCTIRANLASERLMEILKSMNMERITFGAESNSDSILSYLKGESVTAQMNQRAVDLCHRYGIKIGPSFIKGAPAETGEDLLRTYDFILRNIRARKIDYFEIHNLTPFPGTKVWDHALQRGIVSEDMDWEEMKVPWENLYLNEVMPKTSFYFFETLTAKAQEMLGMTKRRVVGMADISPVADDLDEKRVRWIAQSVDRLRADRFFDELLVMDLSHRKEGVNTAAEPLAAEGVTLAASGDIAKFMEEPADDLIVAYFELTDGFDPEKIYNAVWHHFETGVDLTRYAETRFFAPADAFERRIFILSPRAFSRIHRAYFVETEPGSPLPDMTDVFVGGEYSFGIYRPDEDPFVETGATARLFAQRLSADFKLDRMVPEKRAKRLSIIEERIVQKAEALPRIESRRRWLRKSRLGRAIKESDSRFLKGLVKFLLYRD